MKGSEKKNIVWLASYPKSGNTWFRVLLMNLLSDSEDPADINELNKTILASNRSIFDTYTGISSSDLSDDEIRFLRPHLYRKISQDSDGIVFIKVHDAWETNSDNDPLFPKEITKGVIYIIRHPLDVAVSFAFHRNISPFKSLNNLEDQDEMFCKQESKLYNQIPQNLFSWSKHATSWIDDSDLPVHVIRYEDMLSDTADQVAKAMKFLKLNYSYSKIAKAVKNSQFDILKKQESMKGFREKPVHQNLFFRSGTKNNWKNHFQPEQVMSFIQNNREIMLRFNYSEDI